jgi:hypothetical protein
VDDFLLDRRLRQVLRDESLPGSSVIVGIFLGLDDGLGREAVPKGIASGLLRSVCGLWAGALECVPAVRLDLRGRRLKTSRHSAMGQCYYIASAIAAAITTPRAQLVGSHSANTTGSSSSTARWLSSQIRRIHIVTAAGAT